ncbi:MAG: glycosyltransferase family 2 protein [Deltaproteobacteria bacterium]|nr:glycosyltransferase family 2 protein [Deltaproteobacteria bacterium]
MVKAIFWGSLLLAGYVYFIYPVIATLLAGALKRRVNKGRITPRVSIVIAAFNEEAHIGATIENKLKLDYPKDRLEIIVASDGSTDATDGIVKGYADRGVRLIRQEKRQGKTAALNMAVPMATGEIIVFSDSNSIYAPGALRELVSNFADPTVGYVTGKMVYVNNDGSVIGDGCSAYMKYENWLRALETSLGSVVGVDGGIDAVRKSLYSAMRPDQIPDFVLPLKVVEKGYRVVYDPEALLNENSLGASSDEYRMRVRVSLRSLHALRDMRHLLNPAKYGLFSWQLLSHKVLRYGVFAFLGAMYVLNLALAGEVLYRTVFVLQNLFYASALAGLYIEKNGRKNVRLFYIPFYFCVINLAAAHAFWKFLHNEKQAVWVPRKG